MQARSACLPRRRRAASKDGNGPWKALSRFAATPAEPEPPALALVLASRLAALLALDPFDARLLGVTVAFERCPRIASLVGRLRSHGADLALLAAEAAGAVPEEAVRMLRQSPLLTLHLVEVTAGKGGGISISPHWTLDRVLDRAPATDEALVELLVGTRQAARLSIADFAAHADSIDLLHRLLAGALASRTDGVNILLYGPPGTGKTELARSLAAAAGADLFAVGEADNDGDEPTRWDRLSALKLAHRVLARRANALLLFDEMEDLVGDAAPAAGADYVTRRCGSKIFVNRLLETNTVPTIWTSNAIDNVDPAFLRRMSFVLKLDTPGPVARRQLVARIAVEEGVTIDSGELARFADQVPEATTVARVALRTGRLATGGEADARRVAQALVTGLRHGRAPTVGPASGELDLDLYEAEPAIAPLVERLTVAGAPLDYSLLLTGPPGTGKTALAAHLAHRLDRPLIVKRASDLLSKWVGETEGRIAEAFDEARSQGGILLFDEVDSLLFDRSTATRSWEVAQVNELLTWMDGHPLPFVAATNFARRLDPAALRRFIFKLELLPLSTDGAARAFARFFGMQAPAGLAAVANLTPGDFAVVGRQLRFIDRRDPEAIVAMLEAEVSAKPEKGTRIGF